MYNYIGHKDPAVRDRCFKSIDISGELRHQISQLDISRDESDVILEILDRMVKPIHELYSPDPSTLDPIF